MQPQFEPLWPKAVPKEHPTIQRFDFDLLPDNSLEIIQEDPEGFMDEQAQEQDEDLFSKGPQEAENQLLQEQLRIEQEKQHAYETGFEQGKAQGYHQGLEEATQSVEVSIKDCLLRLEKHLDEILSNKAHQQKELTHQVLTFSKRVFAKFFPVLEEKFGELQVEEMVAKVLRDQQPASLKLKVHPKVAESLKQRFLKPLQDRHISIEENEQMGSSDCKLDWEQGGIERNLEKVFQEIELLFKGFEGILHEGKQSSVE